MLNCCIVNPKVGPLSSHNCNCALHQASKVCTHPSVASFAAFFSCNKKFVNCKRRLNPAKTWQRGYESVSVVVRYSFLHYQANLDEAWSDDAVHPGCLLRILGGPLHGDSWTIQAPSPCNRPPSIFGTWAASAHGRLLGTIQYYLVCSSTYVEVPTAFSIK